MSAAPLRNLRLVSFLEGATLVVLVCVAVPLKHLAGYPLATSVVGPIHGFAFLLYAWMLVQAVAGGGWTRDETLRCGIAAFIPFGAFLVAGLLKRKEAALAGGRAA
jgi:integral membrane protein